MQSVDWEQRSYMLCTVWPSCCCRVMCSEVIPSIAAAAVAEIATSGCQVHAVCSCACGCRQTGQPATRACLHVCGGWVWLSCISCFPMDSVQFELQDLGLCWLGVLLVSGMHYAEQASPLPR